MKNLAKLILSREILHRFTLRNDGFSFFYNETLYARIIINKKRGKI